MDAMARIEQALQAAMARIELPGGPPRLAAAMRHSVFPRGARVRPRLCLAVAAACGEDDPLITDAAAAAIELLHCASLVHDDLPAFDNAPTRRGRPSVHAAYGEPLAVLAGDALIVAAFETLARGAMGRPERLAPLVLAVGRAVGMPFGICAGQAWESEPEVVLAAYQQAKTGALFAASTMAGAAAAGAEPAPWRQLGECLGEAYQVVDDILDVTSSPEALGKPIGVDAALGRPNAAAQLGLPGAVARLEQLVAEAVGSIPPCPGAAELRALMLVEAQRRLPKELARSAA